MSGTHDHGNKADKNGGKLKVEADVPLPWGGKFRAWLEATSGLWVAAIAGGGGLSVLMLWGDFTKEGHRNLAFILAFISGLVVGLALQASAIKRYHNDLNRKDDEIARQAKHIHQLQGLKKPRTTK